MEDMIFTKGVGAITGDIAGSFFERKKNRIKTVDFPIFAEGSRFTDDTVLTLAVARAMLDGGSPDDFRSRLSEAASRFPDAGYGQKFRQWIKNPVPYGSYGNGSAMRVSPIGWLCDNMDDVLKYAKVSAAVSHDHPEGIKGAQAVAAAVFMGRAGNGKDAIKNYVEHEFGYDLSRTTDEIRPDYRFNSTCQGSVPEALICFLEAKSFEDAIRLAVSLGGDADTQAAIAASVAETIYPVPKRLLDGALEMLDPFLLGQLREYTQKLSFEHHISFK